MSGTLKNEFEVMQIQEEIAIKEMKEKAKVTKKDISDCFANLKKWGYTVMNAQQNQRFRMPAGMKDFSDYFIFGKGKLFFIENKFESTKDKYTEGQLHFRKEMLLAAEENPFVFYLKCSEVNYMSIHEDILLGNLRRLKKDYL